jgi:hypothetical protein
MKKVKVVTHEPREKHVHREHKDGHMHKENRMSHKGHEEGDMRPVVEDYQRSESSFPERGFSRTTEYIERQDRRQNENSADIVKQGYKGRYS